MALTADRRWCSRLSNVKTPWPKAKLPNVQTCAQIMRHYRQLCAVFLTANTAYMYVPLGYRYWFGMPGTGVIFGRFLGALPLTLVTGDSSLNERRGRLGSALLPNCSFLLRGALRHCSHPKNSENTHTLKKFSHRTVKVDSKPGRYKLFWMKPNFATLKLVNWDSALCCL